MKTAALDFFKGRWTLKADGIFPERIINITKENGIFIQNISKHGENSLFFTVSRKGAQRLFSLSLPSDISLSVHARRGLPALFRSNKHRSFLFVCPVALVVLLFLSTQIIWNVNIVTDDRSLEAHLQSELASLGVKRGTFKFTVNPQQLKNSLLIRNPNLQWIWVNIKGSAAIVNFSLHSPPPDVFDESTPVNICSDSDATVTRISATNGIAKVNVGDSVFSGQLLIEGVMPVDFETDRQIHASGEVYGEVWAEKTVSYPKQTEIRTPTGNKKECLTIFFSKFPIKLFINSSILYPEYDIIEENRHCLPFIVFNKTTYSEVTVSYADNDLEKLKDEHVRAFVSSLENEGAAVRQTETFTSDNGNSIVCTIRVLCEKSIARERRINFGENFNGTNN